MVRFSQAAKLAGWWPHRIEMTDLVTKADLQAAAEALTLRLTVRLGGIMVAGIGALALLLRFA